MFTRVLRNGLLAVLLTLPMSACAMSGVVTDESYTKEEFHSKLVAYFALHKVANACGYTNPNLYVYAVITGTMDEDTPEVTEAVKAFIIAETVQDAASACERLRSAAVDVIRSYSDEEFTKIYFPQYVKN